MSLTQLHHKADFHSILNHFKSNHMQKFLSIIIFTRQHFIVPIINDSELQLAAIRSRDNVVIELVDYLYYSRLQFFFENVKIIIKKKEKKECSLCWCCWLFWTDKITILCIDNQIHYQSHYMVDRYLRKFVQQMGL